MKKILVIDYDQNSLASLQGILAGLGYQVVTAADGQTGWDKYNKESPDLVLMEAMLPRVHGFELCQRITSERNSQATVFIMTGVYKDRVYRTEALRTYGASEYFEKPLKMAELLASVKAVLGKPEPRPAEARPAPAAAMPQPAAAEAAAPPAAEIRPVPAEARRRERPKSDDSIFALPADLDRLSKELPKVRKPAPVRPEQAAEPKFDALADELLKTVLVESSTPKIVKPKPAGGNGNGTNGGGAGPDIDRFLKSALADLDLNKEKVKAAKPAPPAPAPAPPAPVKDKPAAEPVKTAAPEPKPAPATPPPAAPRPMPAPAPARPLAAPAAADMKNTLTPGDPGSDLSPFFVPEKPKPAAKPVERMETPRREAANREPERRERAKTAPPAPNPAAAPAALPVPERSEASVIASAGIFEDIAAPKDKKGFPKILVAVLGVAAVAAVAFILLKPKRPAPAPPVQPPAQTTTQTEAASLPVQEEAPAPKPAPKKVQPQVKPADAVAAAILPAETSAPALPPPGGKNGPGTGGPAASGSSPAVQEQATPKTEEAAPPAVLTEGNPPPSAATEPAPTTDAGSAPSAAPVSTGDLVELATVTEQPRLIKRADPIYPQAAQRIGREGSITVNALVDEKGNVIDTSILKGIQDDKGLAKAAETAVRKWKFQPALKNGVAVKVWKPFVIVFKAEANPAK